MVGCCVRVEPFPMFPSWFDAGPVKGTSSVKQERGHTMNVASKLTNVARRRNMKGSVPRRRRCAGLSTPGLGGPRHRGLFIPSCIVIVKDLKNPVRPDEAETARFLFPVYPAPHGIASLAVSATAGPAEGSPLISGETCRRQVRSHGGIACSEPGTERREALAGITFRETPSGVRRDVVQPTAAMWCF